MLWIPVGFVRGLITLDLRGFTCHSAAQPGGSCWAGDEDIAGNKKIMEGINCQSLYRHVPCQHSQTRCITATNNQISNVESKLSRTV